jgi:2-keto-4-pentenoate hydratase/2-oxohepta-3-ene-1,7-dioic acid hydratase in catechol pathway
MALADRVAFCEKNKSRCNTNVYPASCLTPRAQPGQETRYPTSLGDPWPAPTLVPKTTQLDDCGDYEAEVAVMIGKTAKNVSEADAMSHLLGCTACNDISSHTPQFVESQWSFSKGFWGACPIGAALVSPSMISDPSKLRVRGLKNGAVEQDCGTDDLIFSIPKLISFCLRALRYVQAR